MDSAWGYSILVLFVSIAVFFLCRELWCWYWKINEIRDLLKSIDSKLSSIRNIDYKLTCIKDGVKPDSINVNKEEKKQMSEDEQQLLREKEEKINKLRDEHKSEKTFIFENHADALNQLSTLKDVIQYLEGLGIEDDYFKNTVMPSIYELVELERLYGNMYTSAVKRLKDNTTRKN